MYDNRIKYRAWVKDIKAQYGSMNNYITKERLQWTVLPSSQLGRLVFEVRNSTPFADSEDYKIAWNDWPYGSLEPNVKHLIVWLKKPLKSDSRTGRFLEPEIRVVQNFVDQMFLAPMAERGIAKDKLRWYKNGFDLQSVNAIDHFHVLVKGVPDDLLKQWTGEEEPVV